MACPVTTQIVDIALALRRSHPPAPALDVLDLSFEGHRGAHLCTGLPGGGDHLDPPSPFAALLRDAFAPDLPFDVEVWEGVAPDGLLWADHWASRVWGPLTARYELWRP